MTSKTQLSRAAHLAAALRAERESAGVTQADLAKALGVAQSRISAIEAGKVRVGFLDVQDWIWSLDREWLAFAASVKR